MSAEPNRSSGHNAPWRRFQRRHWLRPLWLPSYLIPHVPAVCMVAWMLRDAGWLWLAHLTSELWRASLLLALTLGLLFDLFAWKKDHNLKRSPSRFLFAPSILHYINYTLTAVALSMGRVDLAVYAAFGLSALSKLQKGGKDTRAALLDLALIGAFALNAVLVVVALLALRLYRQNAPPDLLEVIRKKPSRTEYVRRSREQCAAGGG